MIRRRFCLQSPGTPVPVPADARLQQELHGAEGGLAILARPRALAPARADPYSARRQSITLRLMRTRCWLAFACFVVAIGHAVAEPAAAPNEGPAPRQVETSEAQRAPEAAQIPAPAPHAPNAP